ncbi:MAG: LuxR C-terminal-related transcriptional regulator [Henriciella sp.]|uniref:helix-turn-helix transcriptional regulator n=1 Tax=Henriciella sp. TaxID=1968823 RepID=UPI0032EF0D85
MIEKLLAISQADGVIELRLKTADALKAAGFGAAYFVAPVNSHRGRHRLMTNVGFPDGWEAEYRERAYLTDPLPDIAITLSRPFRWDALPEDVILTEEDRAYIDSLSEWGMETGIGVPTYGPFARTGFVAIGLPRTKSIAKNANTTLLRIIAQTSFLRYCEIIQDEFEELPGLSPREFEVLTRIAQGKSKIAIAAELDVSKDTVDTYFRRIYAKLDVSDRGAAVATAISRGMLIPRDTRVSGAMLQRQPSKPA